MSHTFKKGDKVRVASMAELRAINYHSDFVTATLDTVYVVDNVYNHGVISFVGCEGGWFTHSFVLHEAKAIAEDTSLTFSQQAAKVLIDAFDWVDAREGRDYWNDLYGKRCAAP